MPTLQTYNYALKEGNLDAGIQTIAGSHDIVPIDPVEVGHDRQLLMDWHVVDDLNGCCRTVHQVDKHEDNPILSSTYPYEASMIFSFGTVLREPGTGLFRAWLPIFDDVMIQSKGKVPMCKRGHYYESDDGIEWRRPELGLFEHDGSKANNIFVVSYTDNLYVMRLPLRMHDRGKYAMLYCHVAVGEDARNAERGHGTHNFIAFSDDGIHFTDAPENPIWSGRTDGGNSFAYNAERDVFMMYRRATINAGEIRRIAYSESKDLITWTQPINVIRREENDPLYLYSMHVQPYHGVYLGQLHRLHSSTDLKTRELGNGMDDRMDTELAWSRDGVKWDRHPLKAAFIPVGVTHYESCDWGMVRGMGNMIEMDDHIRVYYGASSHSHAGWRSPGTPRISTICMGTLRRDGFVSIDAGDDGGYMITRPLRYPGGNLRINARTGKEGFIRVAVREASGVRDGQWPKQWRWDQCVPFTGDSLDHEMAWGHGQSLGAFPGDGALRLHFWMENAELYSFRFEK